MYNVLKSDNKPTPLNIMTIKYHFLGDYVRQIRLWGTTDSYSTQLVFILLYFGQSNAFICR